VDAPDIAASGGSSTVSTGDTAPTQGARMTEYGRPQNQTASTSALCSGPSYWAVPARASPYFRDPAAITHA